MFDYNQATFYSPIDLVMEIDNEFPNVTLTTLPIKFLQARYFEHIDSIEIAKKLLHNSVNIYEFKNDDCWARDSGATFLINDQNKLGGVDWEFNGWGKFSPHDSDNKIAKFMIEKSSATYFNRHFLEAAVVNSFSK